MSETQARYAKCFRMGHSVVVILPREVRLEAGIEAGAYLRVRVVGKKRIEMEEARQARDAGDGGKE